MNGQLDTIHCDAKLWSKVVDVKGRARALRFAVPAFVPASIGEPLLEQAPTTVLLDVLSPKIMCC